MIHCWSEAVLPKPTDWPCNVDVVGYFHEEASHTPYQPPPGLEAFLQGGPAPVYVGFGSMKVNDPQGLTRVMLAAGKEAGVRLLLQKGWGGLGEGVNKSEAGPDVYLLESEVSHAWLFPNCSAVVHHGGSGTTAAGLRAGCATIVVPICIDQHLWGSALERCGVGVAIPFDSLTASKLAAAIKIMQRPEVKATAHALSQRLSKEDGVAAAVESFHRSLPLEKLAAGEQVEWRLSEPTRQSALAAVAWQLVNLLRLLLLIVWEVKRWLDRLWSKRTVRPAAVCHIKTGLF